MRHADPRVPDRGMTRPKEFYLLLLACALVEIRVAEGDDAAGFAAQVADTLHHVPEALTLDWSAERDGRVYEQMRAKAGVHGLVARLDAWERAARRRLEHERGARSAQAVSASAP